MHSANVLLDLSFRAKVGDFGLARPLDDSAKNALQTKRVVGTSGYIPPEYYKGTITTKMDTYGYGVILLEIISGMPSYDPQRTPKDLVTWYIKYLLIGGLEVISLSLSSLLPSPPPSLPSLSPCVDNIYGSRHGGR